MRIARLDLLAYGPFRGHSLDLSAPGVHVVFGRNEAGKSTTLRAITGLLYGIPVRTQDAHVHKTADLRIGGTLVAADGTETRVIRRKGASNTLLDAGGEALDEAVLTRLLRGVNEQTFEHAFGLDHVTLARGAQALLEGKGDVGGSLFDASVGGGGDVRRLLVQLQTEADEIYKARGSTQPLNVALKAFGEQQKAVREKEQLPAAYVLQQKSLADQRASVAKLAKERAELAKRRALVESARQRVPLERRRAVAQATVTELAAIASAAPRIASLVAQLAGHDAAKEAAREITSKLERLRSSLADASRHAGVPVADVAALRLDVRAQTRIQKLLQERTRLGQLLHSVRIEIERDARELARRRAEHGPAAAVDEVALASLARALDDARKLGDAQGLLAKQRALADRRRREVDERAAALGLFEGGPEALKALRPPTVAVLDGLAAAVAELEKKAQRSADRLAELDREAGIIEQQLAQASGDFAPPTRADLLAARAARDVAREDVQNAHDSPPPPAGELARLDAALAAAIRHADAVADRMIQEADRVLTLSRHHAQRAALAEQRAKVLAEQGDAVRARATTLAEHHALWVAAGVAQRETELGLADMRRWLGEREKVLEMLAAARDLAADADESARTVAAATEALGAALEALGEPAGTRGRPLAELVDLGSARRSRVDAAKQAAIASAGAIAKLEAQLEERREAVARDEASLAEAKEQLGALLAPFGIDSGVDADEVTRALEALRELLRLEDERAQLESQLAAHAGAVRTFEEQAAAAAETLAPDLAGLPAGDVARELGERRAKALAAVAQLADVEAHLAEAGTSPDLPEDVAALVASPELAASAVEEADARLDELDERIRTETQGVARTEVGLEQLRGDSGAAEAASRAQEALARARVDLERYVRARTAATLLAREIERYRAENQGPLLTKASELFARLTLGHFEGVRAGYDEKDKAALRCVRKGVEVDVTGLSEGTRDQLHLSLRLASLIRHADLAEPMPLVLDDLLVQFDDERSSAALAVLGEVSGRMQILFFTHHARMVDLARAAIPAALLTVHELQSPVSAGGSSAAADPSGPQTDFA